MVGSGLYFIVGELLAENHSVCTVGRRNGEGLQSCSPVASCPAFVQIPYSKRVGRFSLSPLRTVSITDFRIKADRDSTLKRWQYSFMALISFSLNSIVFLQVRLSEAISFARKSGLTPLNFLLFLAITPQI